MTDKPTPQLRGVYRDPSDLRVLAYAYGEDGERKRIAFPASNVDHLRDEDGETTTVVLKSGLEVSVILSFDALYDKLYRPDFRQGDTLDLMPVSSEAKAPKPKQAPRAEFNNRSGPLIITAQLRKPETNSVANITFSEADVKHYYAEATARSKSGQSVRIYFNPEAKKKLPFSSMTTEYVMIDMPNDDLLAALQKAKQEGQGTLDLCALFVANPKKYGLDPQ